MVFYQSWRRGERGGVHDETVESKIFRKKFLTKLKRYGKLKKLLRYETDRASKNFFKKVLDKRNEV